MPISLIAAAVACDVAVVGAAASRRNACNEVDYGAFYGYALELADGRDALDANANPESLKGLTIFGVGAMVRF